MTNLHLKRVIFHENVSFFKTHLVKLERRNIQVLAGRLVIFCHIYKMEEKSFSPRAVFQRLIFQAPKHSKRALE